MNKRFHFELSKDYDVLRRQTLALLVLYNNLQESYRRLSENYIELSREHDMNDVDALRETNNRLTNYIDQLEANLDYWRDNARI
jgi:hypothetical protein